MKHLRLCLALILLVICGGVLGYYLSQLQSGGDAEEARAESAGRAGSSAAETRYAFSEDGAFTNEVGGIQYPKNAIPGEVVLHFSDRKQYLAYLSALHAAGLAPIGQIDELMVVRVDETTLKQSHPGQYGAEPGFSYWVERPLPPVEIAPEALSALQPFGMAARDIVGGAMEGDGSGVLVGILDSGIKTHSQFDDVYIVHIDLAGSGVAGAGAAHGTSVASIISGSQGIAPAAELFVVRVLDDAGLGNSFHVAKGIVQSVDLGVKIINMSLGMYEDSRVVREAVQYAHDQGVIMVAAAGNDGYARLPFPAAYSQVLAVTAVDGNGMQALFPNQSKQIDFAAPGVGVVSANEDAGTIEFSGTSAAAPFVTGTLAALLSADAGRSSSQTVALLKQYLDDAGAPGADPVYGAGLVNWDRLRERGTPGILDVALADVYLDPNALPGTSTAIEVTVQNRGTKWFSNASLDVMVGEAEPVNFVIGSLGPGQTTTRKVYSQVPSLDSDEVVQVAARVLPEKIADDVRLENNLRAVFFRPRSPNQGR